jgi:hypothetical protein
MSNQTREAFQEVVGVSTTPKVDATVFAQNSFFFQQRRGKLDMRSLARVDIERVIEECDVGTLQVHLENLTFSDLTTDDMVSYTDEHFLKLFRLSQLTIEYLLNVQNALLTYSRSVEEETERLKAAADEGDRRLKSRGSKVNSLKRSLKQQRQTLKTYEALLKKQKNEAPQSQAPSPGGGNIMTANDGTTYVSVEYLKRKAKSGLSSSRRNDTEAEIMASRRALDEERRKREQAELQRDWEVKFEKMQEKLMESTKNQNITNQNIKNQMENEKTIQRLENEKIEQENLFKKQLEDTRIDNEKKVEDVRREITEQMRSMKSMMESELRDQRTLLEQSASDSANTTNNIGRSNAGDMESDSDDELHDRESMGSMRKSKRELAKLVEDQQRELEKLRSLQLGMRTSMIQKYISTKDRARSINYKTIAMDGWKNLVNLQKHERQTLSLRVQNDNMTRNETEEEEEEEEEEAPIIIKKVKPIRNGKMFIPTYTWQKCPETCKLPYEDQLDIEEKVNDQGDQWDEVRIPPMWDLALRYDHHHNNSTNTIHLHLSVHRAMSVNDILNKCVEKLKNDHGIIHTNGDGVGSLSLLGTSPGNYQGHHSHVLSKDDQSTVETNQMFVYRPKLVLFSGMTDDEVNEIVKRYEKEMKKLKKNNKRLNKNVRKYMELQDEAIIEELTKSGKLTDEYISSLIPPLKSHNTTQFQSVLSRMLHDENEIDLSQNDIRTLIKEELHSIGLKKKRRKDGSGKKKLRGLTEEDYEMLMEDTEWHLAGARYIK